MYTAKVARFIVVPVCDILKGNKVFDTQQMKPLVINEVAFDKTLKTLASNLESQVKSNLLDKLGKDLDRKVDKLNDSISAVPKPKRRSRN